MKHIIALRTRSSLHIHKQNDFQKERVKLKTNNISQCMLVHVWCVCVCVSVRFAIIVKLYRFASTSFVVAYGHKVSSYAVLAPIDEASHFCKPLYFAHFLDPFYF